MSETIADAVRALHLAGLALDEATAPLRGWELPLPDGAGRLGELSRALRGQWATAVDVRERESVQQASRLSALAGALESVASGYTETDDDARRRHEGVR